MRDDAPAKILVVDDQPAQRMALAAALVELQEEVITVASGADALRLLLDEDVAVILLDVNMPEIDGFETAGLIRQRLRNRHTPIIFLTADTDEMLLPRAYALGAVDFILNPFVPGILRAKVRVFVELSKLHARVRREAEQRIALSQAEAARAAAEDESRRMGFLAEAGAVMGRSLDAPTMIRDLLDLLVPRIADVAAVLLAEDGSRLAWRAGEGADPPGAQAEVETSIRQTIADAAPRALGGARSPWHGLTLPLVARGRTVGALAVLTTASRIHADADLELVRLLSNRAALALDNSRLYREIQERDRQKDEFLAMLSHELRNPLGAITTATHLLKSVALVERGAIRAREVLVRQTSHLARIVDDLLDVAQATTGRITLHREVVDLRDLVEQALEALRVAGRLGRHQVTARLQPGVKVEVDPVRATQVVTNILVNALKYTDAGGSIEVELRAEGAHAVLRICDTGIGMSAEMIQRLFRPFSQEYQALDRSRGGLGLGLTLVRRLVELHEGHVEAQSEGLGRGSVFTVRLPLATMSDTALAAGADDSRAAAPLRILVVEDNSDAREMLRTLLELAGHQLYEAADGQEGLRLARELRPHVALIDLGLPGLDGLEVAAGIRSSPEGDGMVLIALTGYGQPPDRQKSRDAGFDAHLVKPVDGDRLREVLTTAAARLGSRPVAR